MREQFSFRGRVGKDEWLMFYVFATLAGFAAKALTNFILEASSNPVVLWGGVIAWAVFVLVVGLAWSATTVRRLHDTGRRGWWLLVVLIPIAGALWLLFLGMKPGEREANRYGDPPPPMKRVSWRRA